MKRYERKYRVDHLLLPEAEAVIHGHPAGFATLFPDRLIHNIYLDTPELSFLQENLSGVGQRTKYRIRWYGERDDFAASPMLEAKIKDNLLGWKENSPLPDFAVGRGAVLHTAISEVLDLHLPLQPVLINQYRRSYYQSFDGRFRLTLDREVGYANPDYLLPGLPGMRSDEALIFELKYDEEHDVEFGKAIAPHLPFRMSKNSKYVNGMQMCVLT